MSILVDESRLVIRATSVRITADALVVDLEDGRQVSAPLAWYPRLLYGTPAERKSFEIGNYGIHWPELDEDVSIKGLLLGNKSGESPEMLNKWIAARQRGKRLPVKTAALPGWAKPESKRRQRQVNSGK